MSQAYHQIYYEEHEAYLHAGFAPDDTSLWRHKTGKIDLTSRLSDRFKIPPEQIRFILQEACTQAALKKEIIEAKTKL